MSALFKTPLQHFFFGWFRDSQFQPPYSPTKERIHDQRYNDQNEKQENVWQLQTIGFGISLGNFPNPIAFPQDKQEHPKNNKIKPTILTNLIDQDHPILSHPLLLFLVKAVMPPKIPDFPERELSPLSAQ
jgi:hypothetical protein